jgi:hypothetical protein
MSFLQTMWYACAASSTSGKKDGVLMKKENVWNDILSVDNMFLEPTKCHEFEFKHRQNKRRPSYTTSWCMRLDSVLAPHLKCRRF